MGKGIHELQPTTTGGGRVLAADEEFVCCFPFFWLIKEIIEAKLETVRTSSSKYREYSNKIYCFSGESRQDTHFQLCEVLSETQLAIILDRVPEENWNEMYWYYLGDILRSIHHVPHHKASDEYEV